MSLIKHLKDNINGAVSYEYAMSVGKAYKTKEGGHPRETTITRKLRNLVEDGKLETIKNGKIIIGYKKIMIQNYDQEIEKMYHPENFEEEVLSNCCGAEIDDLGQCCECHEYCEGVYIDEDGNEVEEEE